MTDSLLKLLERLTKIISSRGRRYFIFLYGMALKRKVTHPHSCTDQFSWNQISGNELKQEFIYRDESWNEIKHIYTIGWLDWLAFQDFPIQEKSCHNTRVKFNGCSLKAISAELLPFRWIFLKYQRPTGKIYAIEYDVTIGSEFAELQFAFNYRSIMNRVRFMIVDNKKLIFQTVEKGSFVPPICTKSLSLEFGKRYHTRIEVINDSFYYYLDGSLQMAISLPCHGAREDDEFALILFATEPDSRIIADLENFRVFRGVDQPTSGN